jgi:3-isopropylmalate dehydrogenase
MSSYRIAVVAGDGIGPEIVASAQKVLDSVGQKYGHQFHYEQVLAGGCAIDACGEPLPVASLKACLEADSVLLGAVGGPKWETLPGHLRPERALLGIRKELGLFANLRPARLYPQLKDASPLRADIAGEGFDLLIVRELTGGLYFGPSGRKDSPDGQQAFDTEIYSVKEIERIARVAFQAAQGRKKRLCSIDKANVMESSRLWRETVHALAADYPDVQLSDMLVDNAAMQLVGNPAQFDVIVTSNLFGDILSDEASKLTGSIGLLPSASLGEGTLGMYEPIHGSAPDIAGQGLANPLATILSTAMMLRMSFGLQQEADAVERAVEVTLQSGARTKDIAHGGGFMTCDQMTDSVLQHLN